MRDEEVEVVGKVLMHTIEMVNDIERFGYTVDKWISERDVPGGQLDDELQRALTSLVRALTKGHMDIVREGPMLMLTFVG